MTRIYHNPDCGTSRNTLAMIRQSGVEPEIILYLKTPPTREELESLIRQMGITARALLREKGTPFQELGLDNPELAEAELIDAKWCWISSKILISVRSQKKTVKL